MLVTRQKVLRRFWYPVVPDDRLDGPVAFRLLGQDIVLWRDAAGNPAAVIDRCCHRTAKLSRGFVEGGNIVCGYHGWTYAPSGQLVRLPQARNPERASNIRIEGYRAKSAYGYVWVCLGEPLADIPDIEEARAPGFRRIHEFHEPWRVGAFRIMENAFDNAHFTYVHKSSFGDPDPTPSESEFSEHDWGFVAKSVVHVKNPELQRKNLKIGDEMTVRHNTRTWWLPFCRRLRIEYPSGVVHVIITAATPVEDGVSQLTQFVFRNDREEDAPATDVIAFDRQVTNEDRAVLESTDSDAPLDQASGEEFHMPSDKPGLVMRRMFKALLEAHGEREIRRA